MGTQKLSKSWPPLSEKKTQVAKNEEIRRILESFNTSKKSKAEPSTKAKAIHEMS